MRQPNKKTNHWFSNSLFALTITLASGLAHSAEFCMMLGGTKTSGASAADTWTTDNCYGTLNRAFSAMNGGDTLVIDDGEYDSLGNVINHTNRPPSGLREAMTTIKARNIPSKSTDDLTRYPTGIVPVNAALKVRFIGQSRFHDQSGTIEIPTKYVMFEGIHWNGVGTSAWWDYIYFKQCSSMGVTEGNNATWSIGGQYNLLEDVVAYGKGRIKFLFYDYSRHEQSRGNGYNLCRRCVARQDWAKKDDSTQDPINGFFSYYNRGSVFQNVIDIDSNMPEYWSNLPGLNLNGSFTSFEVNNEVTHQMSVTGSLAINNAYGFTSFSNPGNTMTDVAAVKMGGGVFDKRGAVYNRVSLIDVDTSQFSYRSNQLNQAVFGTTKDNGFMPFSTAAPNLSISNIIARGIAGTLFSSVASSDYVNYFDIGLLGTTPTNSQTYDPLQNGLRYPVRVENNSALKTAGSAGGQIGPEIMFQLGVDGTFQGETGWNDVTDKPLWPWPLQEWVQAEMRNSDYTAFCTDPALVVACPTSYTTDASRGFAASGQRLTEYVWASLGNTPPPFNVTASNGVRSVTLSWDEPPADYIGNITHFNVYDITGMSAPTIPGALSPITTVAGNTTFTTTIENLTAGQQYDYAVTAVDSVKGESGYAYVASASAAFIELNTPQDGFVITPSHNCAVAINGLAHALSNVDIYINNTLVTTETANNAGEWSATLDLSSSAQYSGALTIHTISNGDTSNSVSGINLFSAPSKPAGLSIQFQ